MVHTTSADLYCLTRSFFLLRKPIFLSCCIYIFTVNKRCASLSIASALSSTASIRFSPSKKFNSKNSFSILRPRYASASDNFFENGAIVSRSIGIDHQVVDSHSTVPLETSNFEESQSIPKGYQNARVLLVGDGDMSFAAALSTLKICRSLVATTWDSKERLIKSFPRAAENIRIIEENRDTVRFGVDATDLSGTLQKVQGESFDTIAWNFPHIAGKQNIKRNRELVQNFMMSAFALFNSADSSGAGTVKIALCDGQSGTKAVKMDDWNFSWKIVHQAAEAGCLLTDIEEFPLNAFPGYKVTGHRGHGGNFPTGTAPQIFTFKRSAADDATSSLVRAISGTEADVTTADSMDVESSHEVSVGGGGAEAVEGLYYEALQAPSYIHEVHLLAVSMVSDLMDLERRAREGVKLIIAHLEAEQEMERVLGGAEREHEFNQIRLGKQLVPVRRRYRTQEDRDEQAQAKIAMAGGDPSIAISSDEIGNTSDSDSDSDAASIDSSSTYRHGIDSIGSSLSNLGNTAPTRHNSSVWAVNLVDVYTCPRTQQISHAFQVTYCSLTRPIGRTVADTYRMRIERDLPLYLGMVPRVVKHGGLVSLSYPWYVTAAVRTILAGAASSFVEVQETALATVTDDGQEVQKVDVSDLAVILRELELEERALKAKSTATPQDVDVATAEDGAADSGVSDSEVLAALDAREKIRTIARTLWRKRVGVLMQADMQRPSPTPSALR